MRAIFLSVLLCGFLSIPAMCPYGQDCLKWSISFSAIFTYIIYLLYLSVNEFKKRNEYRCDFVQRIYSFENPLKGFCPDFTLKRNKIIMPYPPFLGLIVIDWVNTVNKGEDGEEYIIDASKNNYFHSGKVMEIHWHNDQAIFVCEVEPYVLHEQNDMGAILCKFIGKGWNIYETDGFGTEKSEAAHRLIEE